MKISGVKQKDLMPVFHTTKQGVSTKLARNSWYGKDLVKVAEAVGADLAFVFKDGTIINIRNDEEAPANGSDDQTE
jgi:hypothetical protein